MKKHMVGVTVFYKSAFLVHMERKVTLKKNKADILNF